VGRLLLIDLVVSLVLLGGWYFIWLRYNRRKGVRALRWVELACTENASQVESHWSGHNRLQARLHTSKPQFHWFENPRVTIRLLPRPIPLRWLLGIWKKQKETLTFEADLGLTPGMNLEIMRHRWVTHKHINATTLAKNWTVTRPGPVVLTTRTHWNQELTPVVNALMTSRGHNLLSVRFRSQSPHLAATIDLDALSDEQTAASFLGVLRELAAGASARQSHDS
jgi:hypothetical protein